MNRRCRTCKVIDLIYLHVQRMGDIVSKQLEVFIVEQVVNISSISCEKIVHAENFVSFFEKSVTKVASQKTSAAAN
jgi:hypothetical protein